MSTHTLDEAKNRLPDLVRRARDGEPIVLTEGGRAVARLQPMDEAATPPRRLTPDALERFKTHRAALPAGTGAAIMGELLRARDEDWR